MGMPRNITYHTEYGSGTMRVAAHEDNNAAVFMGDNIPKDGTTFWIDGDDLNILIDVLRQASNGKAIHKDL